MSNRNCNWNNGTNVGLCSRNVNNTSSNRNRNISGYFCAISIHSKVKYQTTVKYTLLPCPSEPYRKLIIRLNVSDILRTLPVKRQNIENASGVSKEVILNGKLN